MYTWGHMPVSKFLTRVGSSSSLSEFLASLPEKRRLWGYIRQSRLANGMACPRCEARSQFNMTSDPRVLRCKTCHSDVSLTKGTVLEGSRLPLPAILTLLFSLSRPINRAESLSSLEKVLRHKQSAKSTYKSLFHLRKKLLRCLAHMPSDIKYFAGFAVQQQLYFNVKQRYRSDHLLAMDGDATVIFPLFVGTDRDTPLRIGQAFVNKKRDIFEAVRQVLDEYVLEDDTRWRTYKVIVKKRLKTGHLDGGWQFSYHLYRWLVKAGKIQAVADFLTDAKSSFKLLYRSNRDTHTLRAFLQEAVIRHNLHAAHPGSEFKAVFESAFLDMKMESDQGGRRKASK